MHILYRLHSQDGVNICSLSLRSQYRLDPAVRLTRRLILVILVDLEHLVTVNGYFRLSCFSCVNKCLLYFTQFCGLPFI